MSFEPACAVPHCPHVPSLRRCAANRGTLVRAHRRGSVVAPPRQRRRKRGRPGHRSPSNRGWKASPMQSPGRGV